MRPTGFFHDLCRWRDISGNFKAEFEQNARTHHKRQQFSLRCDRFSRRSELQRLLEARNRNQLLVPKFFFSFNYL
jgi:hypothetical protein